MVESIISSYHLDEKNYSQGPYSSSSGGGGGRSRSESENSSHEDKSHHSNQSPKEASKNRVVYNYDDIDG